MSKSFNPKDFVRRAPAELLRRYCGLRGLPCDWDDSTSKKVDAKAFIRAIREAEKADGAKEGLLKRVNIDFRSIDELSGKGFTLGLYNEAEHVGDREALTALKRQRSHLAKALWATLYRPQFIPNAKLLAEVDVLPSGAWIKRKSLPVRGLPIDDTVVGALEDALIAYFTKVEWRGENCRIDCLRSGEDEIFFAYAEDHPQTDVFWQKGTLTQQTLSPSFKLIFKHRDAAGTLEIYVDGDRTIVPHIQQIFAKTVIGDEIPLDPPPDDIVYDLPKVLEPGFEFQYSLDLGIRDVRITKMRFRMTKAPWRRFMVEANTGNQREALSKLVARLTANFKPGELVLDQAWIKVHFIRGERDIRDRSPSFCITAPNVLRVQQNEFGERISEMLRQSGIETTEQDDD